MFLVKQMILVLTSPLIDTIYKTYMYMMKGITNLALISDKQTNIQLEIIALYCDNHDIKKMHITTYYSIW